MNPILSRFEQTVREQPDKLAAAYEDERYSFAELRSLSARLGSSVKTKQPQPGAVGVLVRRGAAAVAEHAKRMRHFREPGGAAVSRRDNRQP